MTEIRPLTGLRGVAAVSVFFSHLHKTLTEYGIALDAPEWVRRLFLNGGPQVDVFFVLSGFILTMNYGSWFAKSPTVQAYKTFLRRRFARIYPLYFVLLMLVIAFVVAAHATGAATSHGLDRFKLSELPAHFLLMQAWGIFFPEEGAWNPPSWSISIEAMAYLLFPLLIWATARATARNPWPPVLLAIGVGIGLNSLTHWGLSGFSGLARGLSEFMLGCFATGLLTTRAAQWLQKDAGSLVALALFIACYLLTPDANFLIAAGCVPLLLAMCRANAAGSLFAWRPVFFLGEISYSIYLGHFLFSSIAYRLVSVSWMKTGVWQTTIGILAIAAFVLSLSTVCYYAIERPGRTLFRGRRPAGAASGATA